MITPEFARELERELAMAGEVITKLNRQLINTDLDNYTLRRFKAAALTLTTLESVQLAMSKEKT